jgi:lysozyme family protein
MADFTSCISFTIPAEGGFVNNPKDPGGATNHGIILEGLSEWRGHPCTVQDVMNLTVAEATQIYEKNYFIPMGCPSFPSGLDLMVFDFGANAGPGRSVKMLQKVVGQNPDGDPGPHTIAAAQCSGATLLTRIRALAAAHEAYYRGLDDFDEFGKGWISRVNACLYSATRMANGTPDHVMPQLPKPRPVGYVSPPVQTIVASSTS